MVKNQLKSRTIRFNMMMSAIDVFVANAALLMDLMTAQHFAVTMLSLKLIQTLGNIYYRNITTGPLQ
ncbi:MAG: hypothetical protein OEX12_10850 [Gammaproteobacteria bacterium]|nr:hypothetical protein [Gammaproteobacteria bacterium]